MWYMRRDYLTVRLNLFFGVFSQFGSVVFPPASFSSGRNVYIMWYMRRDYLTVRLNLFFGVFSQFGSVVFPPRLLVRVG